MYIHVASFPEPGNEANIHVHTVCGNVQKYVEKGTDEVTLFQERQDVLR